MHRLLLASTLALAAIACSSETASAQYPGCGNGSFFPFGFYQPYGASYGTSLRTPPYFATNPPVYYGARHARPYGLSPFAAPPLVQAGNDYRSRLRSGFLEAPVATPAPLCNPYIHGNRKPVKTEEKIGVVRNNPFVDPADRLAKK